MQVGFEILSIWQNFNMQLRIYVEADIPLLVKCKKKITTNDMNSMKCFDAPV